MELETNFNRDHLLKLVPNLLMSIPMHALSHTDRD
ncbi:hypothetical protein SAMN04488542_10481 [Fontibacillus panacisegetis]|uniref:Uncharacterized protein n=1 Tax=Fontibacillus panacisegetis TaxID=670482 RepID=A0A1G7HAY1_9BACL|nr:hypothetical protein SAMN04488542_10481 [Fontibacillus panacisegetis]